MAVSVCKGIFDGWVYGSVRHIDIARGRQILCCRVLFFYYFGGVAVSDYKALYRKWRPVDFDDVCGQDGITDILKYEVANSRLSHAYLFCGSRGTGKTSCAKILAKAVNCENPKDGNPCNCCESCRSIDAGIATDVIEMDAASNNGINDVRDMQDEIAFTPALLNYRVYIIDEVHMMSQQAFNALLKTLEEPPTYVIFILATTEHHKLPTTIVSRCQRFDFKRIPTAVIMDRLLSIAKSEGIELTDDAARVIARVSRGGMRDAISLLELCAGANSRIDEDLVFATVGSGNRESSFKIIEAISTSDYETVYSIVNDIVMKSGDISVLRVTEVHLTVMLLSVIYFTVILSLLFDAKSNKNFGTRAQQSLVPPAHELPCRQYNSSVTRLSLQDFLPSAGCCGSHCVRQFTRNIIAVLRLDGPRTMACCRQVFPLCCLRCRIFKILAL